MQTCTDSSYLCIAYKLPSIYAILYYVNNKNNVQKEILPFMVVHWF